MPSTTTIEAIRENMETLIHALTPSQIARTKFKVERGEMQFRDWAEAQKQASFRRYSFDQIGVVETGEVSNLDVEEVYTQLRLTVAYPNDYRYGRENKEDRHDVIEADAMQLRNTIGSKGYGSWVPGQRDAKETHTVEEGQAATFLIVDLDVVYLRSMT